MKKEGDIVQTESKDTVTKKSKKKYHIEKNYFDSSLFFGSCRLIQIGRLYCTKSTVIKKHAHLNWFELTIVTDGKGTVYTNDIAVPVKRGDIYLSFPCDFHSIASDPDDLLKYDFFSFSTEDPDFSKELEKIASTHISADKRIITDEAISSLVSNAIAEADQNLLYSNRLLGSIFEHIIIRLIRSFLNDTPSAERSRNATDNEALCYQLMNYIDTHIYTMTSLDELSEVSNYNYSYLSSLFRRTTLTTLADYYRNRRLETSKSLIEENKLSITHIAELLNYSSIYTYSRSFKEKYGISPGKYKKQLIT